MNKRNTLVYKGGINGKPVCRIMYLIAKGSYTEVTFSNSKKLLLSKELSQVEKIIDNADLLRIHKKFLINKIYIVMELKEKRKMEIILLNGKIFPVADRRRGELRKEIKNNNLFHLTQEQIKEVRELNSTHTKF